MKRREFITLLGGAVAAWPLAVHAQLPSRMRHVGVFLGLTASADDPGAGEILRPFKAAMAEAGWIEDQNIRLDYRFGGGDLAKIHAAAGDLVTLAPDLIYATGLPPLKRCARERAPFRSFSPWSPIRSASGWWRASDTPAATSPGLSFGIFRLAASGCSCCKRLLPISGGLGSCTILTRHHMRPLWWLQPRLPPLETSPCLSASLITTAR